MDRLIRCECGFIARSDTDENVIEEIKKHMTQDHPVLLDQVTTEDLRSWIEVE
jgi:predicted small metal-binding protein